MDGSHFDTLTRSLGTARSRRSLTRLFGGLSLGGLLTTLSLVEVAAGTRLGGSPCTAGRQCPTGKCLKSGRCSCSPAFAECKQPTNACKTAKCNFATKRCVTDTKHDGTECVGESGEENGCYACREGHCVAKADGTTCPAGPLKDGLCQGGVCYECGQPGDSCCTGLPVECGPGAACFEAGTCLLCGEANERCCPPSHSCVEFECNSTDSCTPCGSFGEACCFGNTCEPGLRCDISHRCFNAPA